MIKKYTTTLLTILLFSFGAYSQDFTELIRTYFNENKQTLNLLEEDVSDWIITNEVYSRKSEVTHVYVQQVYNGIPIFNAVGNFAIKNNRILFSQNSFINNIATKSNASTPILSPEMAIEKAGTALNLGATTTITLIESLETNKFIYSKSGISQEKIPVSLVYQPLEDGTVRLSWDLSVLQLDSKHWWSVRIDAVSGNSIHQNDWVVSCNFPTHSDSPTHAKELKKNEVQESIVAKPVQQSILTTGEQYNVFAIPIESPNHGFRSIVTDPHDLLASPFGWHDTDGVVGAEHTITRGNNVHAQEDVDANNATLGNAPDGTAALNFDFPLNLNQAPLGYQNASLTNLFYVNNIMHDVWFQYGFDEEAGSFQEMNYSGTGLGSDSVIADGQDGSGLNNANFATPPDGFNPRMQMFLWSAPATPPAELVTVNSPIGLAGGYVGLDSNYGGPALSSTIPITADLVLADDGIGATEDACTVLNNAAAINGKIAVIRRGDCDFTVKVQFAQDAGAIAVIMINNEASPAVIIMGGTSLGILIPAVMISQADGVAIIDGLNNGDTINATLLNTTIETFEFDGSFDTALIAHEYGHGITNRLIGGPGNAGCMGNAEQLGEGWSDFFGLMITMKASDTADDARGIVTYPVGQPTDGSGIRTHRYTTDMSVNPFTFINSNTAIVPHELGTIWATMMWDLNWRMIEAYGFDTDFYNGTGGNNMTMHLAIESLKLVPCGQGFVAARDAIIAADEVLYNGENKCLIWQVFSRRGLGYTASSGFPSSSTDQIEAFDMPPAGQLGGASCSLSVDDEKSDLFMIYPNPSNGEININGIGINEEVTIRIFDVNGREVFAKRTILNGSINIDATNLNSGFYILKIKGDEFIHNKKIIIK
ncbi:MAG: T9SS-dependent M36 family metallopeptidase [Flavobacteriaceae bacterium]|nr:T9SS-dependent M36 family metallopeptidase [Flavobacteriaceae bacterium]